MFAGRTNALPFLILAGLVVWFWALSGCGSSTDVPDGPTPVTIEVDGFPPLPSPADNPLTEEGIALGRLLFYDPILSGDSTLSCAGCHAQAFAFSDSGKQFSVGIDGIAGDRNAPTVINAGWLPTNFWDGRAPSLEDQALQPVPNEIEMHESWDNAVAKLTRHTEYPQLFEDAFGSGPITSQRVVQAIAQFERTFVSYNSKYDRFKRGEVSLSESELRGFDIFFRERGDCFHCHGEPFFTDHLFHNNGLDSTFTDVGLEAVSGRAVDRGKFKTPTLRNIEFSAPYMHDGRFQTLEQVVNHYNSGGHFSPTVDPVMRIGTGLGLSTQERDDIVAFMKTLSDPTFLNNPDLSNPFE